MAHRIVPLFVLLLVLGGTAAGVLTGTGGEAASAGPGDQPPIRSDEGIDPNECNLVHNIDACEGMP